MLPCSLQIVHQPVSKKQLCPTAKQDFLNINLVFVTGRTLFRYDCVRIHRVAVAVITAAKLVPVTYDSPYKVLGMGKQLTEQQPEADLEWISYPE